MINENDLNIYGRKVYRYTYKLINSNMYIILGNKSAVMVDSIQSEKAIQLLREHGIMKLWILITHEHYDHIQGINYYRQYFECCVMGSKYALEAIENPRKNLAAYLESLTLFKDLKPDWREYYQIPQDYTCHGDMVLDEMEPFVWENIKFYTHYTPGHSKGSICIMVGEDYCFTGDSLIAGEKIILRLPGSSKKTYMEVTKPFLNQLKRGIVIFPGHGESGQKEEFEVL